MCFTKILLIVSTILCLIIVLNIFYKFIYNTLYKPVVDSNNGSNGNDSNNSSGLTGGTRQFKKLVVIPISNYLFQRLELENYVWTVKHDGIHKLLKIYGDKLYDISDGKYQFIRKFQQPFKNVCCEFEAEEMQNGKFYYILDIMSYQSIDVTRENYLTRMNHKKSFEPYEKIFIKTEIHEIKDIKEILKFANSFQEHSDGIILHSTNTGYNGSRLYKIKPRTMNTIDVYVKNDKLFVEKPHQQEPLIRLVSFCDLHQPL